MAGHKVLAVHASSVVEFWKEKNKHHFQVVKHGLPHDAKITGVGFNAEDNTVEFIVYSMSYEFVKPGHLIPYVKYVPEMQDLEKP